MAKSKQTLRQAAIDALREHGPLHYQSIAKKVLASGDVASSSKTPAASLNAVISVDIKRNGLQSEFVRIEPGVFGLRTLHAPQTKPSSLGIFDDERDDDDPGSEDEAKRRVRAPWFPKYNEVRTLLKVWPGHSRTQITKLHAKLRELSGTPQSTLDWTKPDTWIPKRLSGDDRDLASTIWTESNKTVNPRHTYGHWLLSRKYGLIEDGADGSLILTDSGRDFVDHDDGETVTFLDEQEGLTTLLALVADHGSTRAGDLLDEWVEYLLNHNSPFGKPSTFRDTVRRRLGNLLDRGLVNRKGVVYSITDMGSAYLRRIEAEEDIGDDVLQKMRDMAASREIAVRDSIRELLLEMDPTAFEHLIKKLLEKMEDYENVDVTARSGDGGADVIADVATGITLGKEIVQVKRHTRTIQRKDVDALRGSLPRFNAIHGSIITTSSFAKGAKDAASADGVAPIRLIDCDDLIDLLFSYEVGISNQSITIWKVDQEAFSDLGNDE